jgi:hypothetical protein
MRLSRFQPEEMRSLDCLRHLPNSYVANGSANFARLSLALAVIVGFGYVPILNATFNID